MDDGGYIFSISMHRRLPFDRAVGGAPSDDTFQLYVFGIRNIKVKGVSGDSTKP